MVDGVIESHTAAMLEPYTDDPSLKGKLFWDPDKYKAAVAELDKRGLQLFTHAIGDYGVRTALDGYENAEEDKSHRRTGARASSTSKPFNPLTFRASENLASSPACSRCTPIPTTTR